MDEIDGMNSGDKGGINSLIKLIRPKKTKKQNKKREKIVFFTFLHLERSIQKRGNPKLVILECLSQSKRTVFKQSILMFLQGKTVILSQLSTGQESAPFL